MSRLRAARDPLYAEAAFDRWYARLLRITGSHSGALAAYNGGLGGRHRKAAKDYAERALNLATRLAMEQQ